MVVAPIGVLVLALQIITAMGLLAEYLVDAYYLGLLWSLFVAATRFGVLLLKRDAA